MSARSRAVPWFGTLGARIRRAHEEALSEDVLRSWKWGFWATMPNALREEHARRFVWSPFAIGFVVTLA